MTSIHKYEDTENFIISVTLSEGPKWGGIEINSLFYTEIFLYATREIKLEGILECQDALETVVNMTVTSIQDK